MSSDTTIRPVATKADRKAFVDFAWEVYKDDPNWVPPLKDEVHGLLDPKKNPWFGHGRAQLWLAERGGRVVGRISAQVDDLVQVHMEPGTGQWGMFEALDGEAAAALIATAEDWLRGEGMTFFLMNVVPFLNLVLAGFVLASVAARFIFPGVSLEGRTFWLLRSSPMSMRQLLWSKFWVGTLPLLMLALAIVGVTDVLLQVTPFMMIVSIGTITFMTLAVAGLALGFGTMFPQFETENAAQIPTSFGGLVFMMSSIALIGLVIVLEARPVYTYLSAQAFGEPTQPLEMVLGFGLAVVICGMATLIPIEMAVRRLERGES